MLDSRMAGALNEQCNAELYSSYLYLSMGAYFESQKLKGFANWMRVQAQEELMHAMKFYDFINERGARALMKAIEGPPTEWESPLAVFEHVYEHEQKVTSLIAQLVALATELSDHPTNDFLRWFVAEQVEEEESANDVLQKVKLAADAPMGLMTVDRELAQRTFAAPAAGEGAAE